MKNFFNNYKNIYLIIVVIISLIFGMVIGMSISSNKTKGNENTSNISIDLKNNINDTQNNTNMININTATISELGVLGGIGDVKSKQIIENRPYANKSQLLNVISENLYNQIKDRVVCE